ncbi:MAG: DNA methylase [Planctomycetaceae bacterium]|nr:DNA methylase [Planctomycetaceae bacterium]
MAQSPTHKFGQIIGELIERPLYEPLLELAKRQGLYLDSKHSRPARGGKNKVAWQDSKGNWHDLDYVLEAGGSEETLGRPKAFIEVAYRRYTKHSRNKAQEMQGAILPLAETYAHDRPFLGVVLAGVFTEGSVTQLRSHGFGVLYFPFASIVAAFQQVGIDAAFDESSSDRDVKRKVIACAKLRQTDWNKIVNHLRHLHRTEIESFLHQLEVSLSRTIQTVFVVALHDRSFEGTTVDDAIHFIEAYDESSAALRFCRYEVNIRYTNGDEVRATFASKLEAIRFLTGLRLPTN